MTRKTCRYGLRYHYGMGEYLVWMYADDLDSILKEYNALPQWRKLSYRWTLYDGDGPAIIPLSSLEG